MTKEEALQYAEQIKDYLCEGNPIWDIDLVKEAMDMAIEALEKKKIGFWIRKPHPNWGKWGVSIARCSECGFFGGTGKWNYCPNCQAKMVRGGEEDEQVN